MKSDTMDERRSLLPDDTRKSYASTSTEGDDEERKRLEQDIEEPFQSRQIFALCCAAVAEPVACFCIFPFIGEMIEKTGGIPESDVGFWAGVIESLFSVVQMALMIVYGRMSDRFGRKPVLVVSLTGLSIFTMMFGLSRSLFHMVIFRCLAGSFAGSVLTVRIMVSESCTKSTEGRAFAWFMFARNFGILLGPIIGGLFVNVELFGSSPTLQSYIYFPATFAAGLACLFGTFLVVMFSKETLSEQKVLLGEMVRDPMTTWQLLQHPGVASALCTFAYTMFLALANTAVLPIFLFTSIDNGGFGFSPQWISYFLAGLAASQGLWTLACFPSLKRRLGNDRVMRFCSAGWPLLFAFFPLLNELLRRSWLAAFWATLPLPLVVGGGIAMSFAGAQLLVNNACPSPYEMALINAITQTLNSAVRAVTPALFTSIFALGTRHQILHGHLCWTILVLLSLPLSLGLHLLPFRGSTKSS